MVSGGGGGGGGGGCCCKYWTMKAKLSSVE